MFYFLFFFCACVDEKSFVEQKAQGLDVGRSGRVRGVAELCIKTEHSGRPLTRECEVGARVV